MVSGHADRSGDALMPPTSHILQDDSTLAHLFVFCKLYHRDTLMLIDLNGETSHVG